MSDVPTELPGIAGRQNRQNRTQDGRGGQLAGAVSKKASDGSALAAKTPATLYPPTPTPGPGVSSSSGVPGPSFGIGTGVTGPSFQAQGAMQAAQVQGMPTTAMAPIGLPSGPQGVLMGPMLMPMAPQGMVPAPGMMPAQGMMQGQVINGSYVGVGMNGCMPPSPALAVQGGMQAPAPAAAAPPVVATVVAPADPPTAPATVLAAAPASAQAPAAGPLRPDIARGDDERPALMSSAKTWKPPSERPSQEPPTSTLHSAGRQLLGDALDPGHLDDDAQGYPSVGSKGHATGECHPCAFFWKPKGCGLAVACDFCHLCPADEKKRRQKAKIDAIRASQAALG